MKISLDGGAICTNKDLHFGNYTFTKNLLAAIKQYDRENNYIVYSFCAKPIWLRLNNNIKFKSLIPKTLWLSTRVSLEEMREKKDIFLALNQAIPLSVSSRVISFSHGLSYYFFPGFYPDSFYALKDQLDPMINKSRYILVASRRVKIEMKKLYPNYQNFVTINYGVPFDMLDYRPVKRQKYFMFVGMNHKIKNIDLIIKAFRQLKRHPEFSDYKLYLIGNLKQFEEKLNGIITYTEISREQLKKLYAEAAACLTASYYESFNFPVLEALAQNCPVIGLRNAIIPEFKDYVFQADDETGFLKQMIEIHKFKNLKSYRQEVLKRFSWKKYIAKLQELYIV